MATEKLRAELELITKTAEKDLARFHRSLKSVEKTVTSIGGKSGKSMRPLGEGLSAATANASEFEKSMAAANARVIAFGASAGLIIQVQRALKETVKATVEVEKALTDINIVLNANTAGLQKFGDRLFKIAGQTGQSFKVIATGATELTRQGLGTEKTLSRLNDAMILSRLTGMGAEEAVSNLTAAVNSFSKAGITSAQVINKMAKVDQAFAVSSDDLAKAISRVGSSAVDAGVSMDELLAITTAVQQRTARGGAVIGNAFKTIFTRIGRTDVQKKLNAIGVETRDMQGHMLGATKVLQNLADKFGTLGQMQQNQLAESVAGVFQVNILRAALGDLSSQYGINARAIKISASATDEAYKKNEKLNETLDALANKTLVNLTKAGAGIGEATLKPAIENILGLVNSAIGAFEEGGIFEEFGKGIGKDLLKGIGSFISGPGLAILTIGIGKLLINFGSFAKTAIAGVLELNKSVMARKGIEDSVTAALMKQPSIIKQIERGELSAATAAKDMLATMRAQNMEASKLALTSRAIAGSMIGLGARGGRGGKASGFVPNFADAGTERASAAAGGYKAGVIKTMNVPGEGSVMYNGAETVKRFPGMTQPAIMPPKKSLAGANYKSAFGAAHGFDPYAAEGFTPNFVAGRGMMQSRAQKKGMTAAQSAGQLQIVTRSGLTVLTKGLDYKIAGGKARFTAVGEQKTFSAGLEGGGTSLMLADGRMVLSNKPLHGMAAAQAKIPADKIENLVVGGGFHNVNRGQLTYRESDFVDSKRLKQVVTGAAADGFIPNFPRGWTDPGNLRNNQVSYRVGAGDMTREYAQKNYNYKGTAGLGLTQHQKNEYNKKGAKDSVKEFLDVKGQLGIVSLYGASQGVATNRTATMSVGQLGVFKEHVAKNPEIAKERIRFGNIQVSTLKGLEKNLMKEKKPSFSSLINKHLISPLANIGAELVGTSLGNQADPIGAIKRKMEGQTLLPKQSEGELFETAIKLALHSPKRFMQSMGDSPTAPFDFEEGTSPTQTFKKRLGFQLSLIRADAKRTSDPAAVNSLVKKAYNQHILIKEGLAKGPLLGAMGGGAFGKSPMVLPMAGDIRQEKAFGRLKGTARRPGGAHGFVPNYSPLGDAVTRERAAGVPVSAIRVSSSPALRGPGNPGGLGVHNTIDDPAGLGQGISRSRRMGISPKTHGAAGGFVPNFEPSWARRYTWEPGMPKPAPAASPLPPSFFDSFDKEKERMDREARSRRDSSSSKKLAASVEKFNTGVGSFMMGASMIGYMATPSINRLFGREEGDTKLQNQIMGGYMGQIVGGAAGGLVGGMGQHVRVGGHRLWRSGLASRRAATGAAAKAGGFRIAAGRTMATAGKWMPHPAAKVGLTVAGTVAGGYAFGEMGEESPWDKQVRKRREKIAEKREKAQGYFGASESFSTGLTGLVSNYETLTGPQRAAQFRGVSESFSKMLPELPEDTKEEIRGSYVELKGSLLRGEGIEEAEKKLSEILSKVAKSMDDLKNAADGASAALDMEEAAVKYSGLEGSGTGERLPGKMVGRTGGSYNRRTPVYPDFELTNITSEVMRRGSEQMNAFADWMEKNTGIPEGSFSRTDPTQHQTPISYTETYEPGTGPRGLLDPGREFIKEAVTPKLLPRVSAMQEAIAQRIMSEDPEAREESDELFKNKFFKDKWEKETLAKRNQRKAQQDEIRALQRYEFLGLPGAPTGGRRPEPLNAPLPLDPPLVYSEAEFKKENASLVHSQKYKDAQDAFYIQQKIDAVTKAGPKEARDITYKTADGTTRKVFPEGGALDALTISGDDGKGYDPVIQKAAWEDYMRDVNATEIGLINTKQAPRPPLPDRKPMIQELLGIQRGARIREAGRKKSMGLFTKTQAMTETTRAGKASLGVRLAGARGGEYAGLEAQRQADLSKAKADRDDAIAAAKERARLKKESLQDLFTEGMGKAGISKAFLDSIPFDVDGGQAKDVLTQQYDKLKTLFNEPITLGSLKDIDEVLAGMSESARLGGDAEGASLLQAKLKDLKQASKTAEEGMLDLSNTTTSSNAAFELLKPHIEGLADETLRVTKALKLFSAAAMNVARAENVRVAKSKVEALKNVKGATGAEKADAATELRRAKIAAGEGFQGFGGLRDSFRYNINDAALEFDVAMVDLGYTIKDSMKDAIKNIASGADSFKDAMFNVFAAVADKLADQGISMGVDSMFNWLSKVGQNKHGGYIPRGYNQGGVVAGGSGVRDDVMTRMQGGEYVIKKSAAQKIGYGTLGAINSYGGGGKARVSLAKEFLYTGDDPRRPTGGNYNVSRNLSTAALFREDDPQTSEMFGRQSTLTSYLEYRRKEQERRDKILDGIKQQKKQRLTNAYMSAAMRIGVAKFGEHLEAKNAEIGGKAPLPAGGEDQSPTWGGARGGSPAMVMGGEYVMSPRAVSKYGTGFMSQLNQGRLPSFQSGGLVGGGAAMAAGITTNNVSLSVNIDKSGGATAETGGGSKSEAKNDERGDAEEAQRNKEFAEAIRGAVLKEITKQQRPGGLLRDGATWAAGRRP